jgi:hypothetical protein
MAHIFSIKNVHFSILVTKKVSSEKRFLPLKMTTKIFDRPKNISFPDQIGQPKKVRPPNFFLNP